VKVPWKQLVVESKKVKMKKFLGKQDLGMRRQRFEEQHQVS
jgi:hypothetical protein